MPTTSIAAQTSKASRPSFTALETRTGFRATMTFKNPDTGKLISRPFALRFSDSQKSKLKLTESLIVGILKKVMSRITIDEITNRFNKKGMASLIHHYIKKLSRRTIFQKERNSLEVDGVIQQHDDIDREIEQHEQQQQQYSHSSTTPTQSTQSIIQSQIDNVSVPFSKTSIFIPEETGVTYAVLGKSFCGKTTFVVSQLNLLTPEELRKYNAIIMFTESPHAAPLGDVSPAVRKKMIVMDCFCPTVLKMLKKVNDGTGNRFKFLTIFDDILNLRGGLMTKSILTLRNSNISTVISVQYEKVLNPAQRASIHNVYLVSLRAEAWLFMLQGYLLGNFKDLLPAISAHNKGKGLKPTLIAQILRESLNDYIVHYDQRKDGLTIYQRP